MTCRTLEEFYHIDGHTFEKQYNEVLSGYRDWEQLSHADEWMLFPDSRLGVGVGRTCAQVKASAFPSTSTLWPRGLDTPKNLGLF